MSKTIHVTHENQIYKDMKDSAKGLAGYISKKPKAQLAAAALAAGGLAYMKDKMKKQKAEQVKQAFWNGFFNSVEN